MLRKRWLKELAGRSRKVSDRMLLCGSGGKGSRNKIIMIWNKFCRTETEKLLKDNFPIGNGGKGKRKEKQKIRGRLGKKRDTITAPWQRR